MVAQLGRHAVYTTRAVGTSEVWWGVQVQVIPKNVVSVGWTVEYYILPGVLVCRVVQVLVDELLGSDQG